MTLARVVAGIVFAGELLSGHAQPRGIAGDWEVVYERRVSPSADTTVATTATARMILELHGDSIAGRWEPTNLAIHQVALPLILHGTFRSGTARVIGDPDEGWWDQVMDYLRENIHGIHRAVTTVAYEFTVRGDSLVGTLGVRGADGNATEKRSFTAKRVRP